MKKILRVMLVINFFNYFSENLLIPVYAAFTQKLGGDLFTAGSALAISYAVIGVGIMISGKFAEKHHTEKLQMLIGLLMNLLVVIGYMNIKSPFGLYIVFIFAGFAVAIQQPAFSGLYSSLIEKGKHASSWGYIQGLTYLTIAISSVASGFITEKFGFTALFQLMFLTTSISVIGAAYLLRSKNLN